MRAGSTSTARRAVTTLALALALVGGGTELASAANAGATGAVNIRSGPSTAKAVVGGLVKGQIIPTAGKAKGGWVKVRFAGSTAYVASEYLATKRLPAGPKSIDTSGVKVATVTLNVRTGPSPKYRIVGTIPEGQSLTLTGKLTTGYAQTTFKSHARWISIRYLASTPAGTTTAPAPTTPVTPPPVTDPPADNDKGQTALAYAKKQLGKPYKFGATGPKAFDCSGLTLRSWQSAGVTIPRTSQQQFTFGTKIAKKDLQPGDLVFFYGPKPHHVAIYVGDGIVIHAPRPGKKVQYIKMSYMPYAGARRPG